MSDKPYLPDVKLQYESFPYPPRNPADEARRLIYPVLGSLLVINHHCFRGRRDFRNGFRCLVAGGGTGDTTIYLAEQLRSYAAEIVYLDMSDASRQVAEERARVRGLTIISWVSASILELPRLALGKFGNDLPEPRKLNTVHVEPGGTYDIMIHGDNPGYWAFHDHNVQQTRNNGIYPGGMHSMLMYEDFEPTYTPSLSVWNSKGER